MAGALASALVTCAVLHVPFADAASADVRIVNDPGGEVSSYVQKFQEMRAAGDRVVIDGPCLSACTLLTGIIPRDRVCVTSRAVLGFHAASYYDDASRSLVPTGKAAASSCGFIRRRSGLDRPSWRIDAALMLLRGRELTALYPTCQ